MAEVGGGAESHVTLAARALHGLHEERARPLAKERAAHRQGAGTAEGRRLHTLGTCSRLHTLDTYTKIYIRYIH